MGNGGHRPCDAQTAQGITARIYYRFRCAGRAVAHADRHTCFWHCHVAIALLCRCGGCAHANFWHAKIVFTFKRVGIAGRAIAVLQFPIMKKYDVTIIGSGPGGYVGAIRASQLGLKVALVERDKPGGVCLNVGCIPSKSLIHQAEIFTHGRQITAFGAKVDLGSFDYSKVQGESARAAATLSQGVQYLIKKNAIDYIAGEGALTDGTHIAVRQSDGKSATIESAHTIIATGSRPREIRGFEFDEQRILSSTGALALNRLPKSLIILGAGVIGMEFAHIMSAFGVKVTVVELLPTILLGAEKEFAEQMRATFAKRGVTFLVNSRAESVTKKDGVSVDIDTDGKKSTVRADMLLVAVGRAPNSENLGLEKMGIKTERGFIETGDFYQTGRANIYAVGDVIDTPQLAHVASKESEIAVEHIAGKDGRHRRFPSDLYPAAVYTEPELAWFGPTEEQLREQNRPYKQVIFPYRGAGKSVAIKADEGRVKLLVDPNLREILAAHIIGKNATELIHELLLAKQAELLPSDIAEMVHAHPTLAEATLESARAVEGWAIHI